MTERPTTPASSAAHPTTVDEAGSVYEIRVRGHLAPRWSAWFDGLAVSPNDDGTTTIRGPVVDQAALHGLIQRLRDVGVDLVSLALLPDTQLDEPTRPSPPGGQT